MELRVVKDSPVGLLHLDPTTVEVILGTYSGKYTYYR